MRVSPPRFFATVILFTLLAWSAPAAGLANDVNAGGVAASAAWRARAVPGAALARADDALLDELQRASFRFFAEQCHPRTGLVRDRARADGSPSEGMASLAASGFALTAWAIATERNWVERGEAVARVRTMLRFLADDAPREHGFFYHFMEMATGARAWKCELSSIDTGLFLAGAIVAREYFHDAEITALVNRIYREVDWRWFRNGGETVALGWYPETGFSRYRWTGYSEHMMMSFLALGAPEHALDGAYWRAWKRRPVGNYAGYHYIQGPPLFIHQFTHAFVDFRGLRDAFADYHRNSVLATLAQREFCLNLRAEFPSWSEKLWGLTSSDSATGYKGWGGPPRTVGQNSLDGTIAPCAAAGSVPFAPEATLPVLRHLRGAYGGRAWQRYGFVDALNPDKDWFNPDVVGIDVGISLVQAENARTGMVWALFRQAPEVSRALEVGGFVNQAREFTTVERQQLQGVAQAAWRLLADAPIDAADSGLRLTAIAAALGLGLTSTDEAMTLARAALRGLEPPATEVAVAEYVAGLITLRRALPALGHEVARRIEAVRWAEVPPAAHSLASASRLAAFLKIALGGAEPSTWTQLARTPEAKGTVFVLAPANGRDQLTPGLWLDERAIISGASAAQLAYATLTAPPAGVSALDTATAALLLAHFPREVLNRGRLPAAMASLATATAADRGRLLVTLANLLAGDCVRHWFQQDAAVKSARDRIPEFAAAAFGDRSSVFFRDELAGPPDEPPVRRTTAVAASAPRERWHWERVAGLEHKDSPADVRPGDPALELRFALTWDADALHLHAEAMDTPPGFTPPPERKEFVELVLDPQNDGVIWLGADDVHLLFRSTGQGWDWTHGRAFPARIERTPTGYTVQAEVPWTLIGLTPRPGLEFGLTAAIVTDGRHEWQPSLKLNWRFYQRRDDRFGIGLVRLE